MASDDQVKLALLSIRPLIIRIAVVYERETAIEMTFGSGCLITSNLFLTCAHIFDPILWDGKKIAYSQILVCSCDPAPNRHFSLLNPDKIVFPAEILQRGLMHENIDRHAELKDTDTDLALLMVGTEMPNIPEDQYFNPKLNTFSAKSAGIPSNSNLYLVGYNGELHSKKELAPYKHLNDFNGLTIHQLNQCHHVNYKSISVGSMIQDASRTDPYALHN
jgi:hypothetical protein